MTTTSTTPTGEAAPTAPTWAPSASAPALGSLRVAVAEGGGFERDRTVDVTVQDPAATVGQLASALGFTADGSLTIDGCAHAPDRRLVDTGVRRGSRVGPATPAGRAGRGASPTHVLRTLSGPDSGRRLELRGGAVVLGRSAAADVRIDDPLLAGRQAVLEAAGGTVTVTDLAPPRPTRAGGSVIDATTTLDHTEQMLTAGSTRMTIERLPSPGPRDGPTAAGADRPGPTWTVPLRRPPLRLVPPLPAPVVVPVPTSAPAGPSPLGLATIVTSLLAATVVALVLDQLAFLLLGAVGAVGTAAVAGWQRWRHHRRRRAATGLDQAALEGFRRDLRAHQEARAHRLRVDTVDVVGAVNEVLTAGARRWTRRRGDADAFRVVVGRGERLLPPVLEGDPTALGPDGWALVEAAATVSDVPIVVDLGPGAVVGVVGAGGLPSALARALIVQLAVAHGPADLLVAGLTAACDDLASGGEHGWLSWLPHAGETSGEAAGETRIGPAGSAAEVLAGLVAASGEVAAPHLLLAVFEPSALVARNSPARQVLASAPSAAAVVVATDAAQLPGICTTVIDVRPDAVTLVHRPGAAELADRVEMAGLSLRTAVEVARGLAGLSDPERHDIEGMVPALADGREELGRAVDDAEWLRATWSAAGADPPLRTRLAVAADGPIEVDLVRDGPHALVAGTTGAGKSELLRSLIAGLAVATGPDDLQFVLVDYKGGAAFDACARLPHVAGLVTDLDEELAERALRSLDAELRRRERILRDAGAADLAGLRAQPGHVRLPRLVVVVDEFATLAADLPGFVPSLVGVAQRGRSLGVHLILATQRPGGVVSEDIRANANLRIALRVQSAADSVDVLGDPLAASLPRRRPGRAVFRFGPGELVIAQVISVSRPLASPASAAVTVEPVGARCGADGRHEPPNAASEPTLLARLADTACRAAGPCRRVHRPWLPPLPVEVWTEDLPAGAAGLLDDPDRQLQEPWTWSRDGHLLCAGAVGSGVAEALATIALATAAVQAPAGLHLHVVSDHPALAALAGLPHVGAVLGTTDDERQGRFLRRVERWLDERAAGDGGPDVVIVADELGAWRQAVADRLGPDSADTLDRLLVEGPARGLVLLAGVDRFGAVPTAVSGGIGERLVFRLGDPAEALVVGVRAASVAKLPAGRAVIAGSGLVVQVARARGAVAEAVAAVGARWSPAPDDAGARPVGVLPRHLPVVLLPEPRGDAFGGGWWLPLGLSGDDLEPVGIKLHLGDHLLVAGPSRSGRSSALALIAGQLQRAAPAPRLFSVCRRVSALATVPGVQPIRIDDLAAIGGPAVVLVDDAELVEDPTGRLAELAAGGGLGEPGGVSLVVAGRHDALRAAYGHWTQVVRRQRRGLLLRPSSDVDGDLLGAVLPRRPMARPAPGRGYVIAEGTCSFVQLATSGVEPDQGCSTAPG